MTKTLCPLYGFEPCVANCGFAVWIEIGNVKKSVCSLAIIATRTMATDKTGVNVVSVTDVCEPPEPITGVIDYVTEMS